MATTSVLSDDLLRKIFLWLPSPEALVHAVLACKVWLRAACDADFLRRFHALHPLPHAIGLLYSPVWPADHSAGFFCDPATACWSDAIASRDFSLSYLPGGPLSKQWDVSACHDGRILLREERTWNLIVADPSSRRGFRIRRPPTDLTRSEHRLVCDFLACRRSDRSFQVLRFVQDASMHGGVFSSSTRAWRRLGWCGDTRRCLCKTSLRHHAHVEESLYWVPDNCQHILELDTATMEFSSASLPADLCAGLLEDARVVHPVSTEDGRVGVLVATRNLLHVKLWVRGDGGWAVEKEAVLQEKVQGITGCSVDNGLRIEGSSRGIVFLSRRGYKYIPPESYDLFMSLRLETMELRMIRRVEAGIIYGGFHPYEAQQPPPFLDPDRQSNSILSLNP